jgi:hypothetical protein
MNNVFQFPFWYSLLVSTPHFSFFPSLVLRSSVLIGIASMLYLPVLLTSSVLIVRCGCRSASRLGFSRPDITVYEAHSNDQQTCRLHYIQFNGKDLQTNFQNYSRPQSGS